MEVQGGQVNLPGLDCMIQSHFEVRRRDLKASNIPDSFKLHHGLYISWHFWYQLEYVRIMIRTGKIRPEQVFPIK